MFFFNCKHVENLELEPVSFSRIGNIVCTCEFK